MDLKTLANSYTTPDGKVTFWMLPFTPLRASARVSDLNTIVPQSEWVHAKTGEHVTSEPAEYRSALIQAEAFETEPQTPWRRISKWSNEHTCFAACEPVTIDIVVAEDAPAHMKALGAYWQARTGSITEDWPLFNELLSYEAIDQWFAAYGETRDKSMALPAGETTDPQPAGDAGRGGSTTSSSTRPTSPKPSAKPRRAAKTRS